MPNNKNAVYCPKREDHGDHRKILFVFDDEAFYVFCKAHGWMKVEMTRLGSPISINDCQFTVSEMPRDFHFDLREEPVVALGNFSPKSYVSCRS